MRKDVIVAEKVAVGFKEAFLIMSINSSKLKDILAEANEYRPLSMKKIMEIQRKEKNKFAIIDDKELSLVKNIMRRFFSSSPTATVQTHINTTLGQELKKSYRGENDSDAPMQKSAPKESSAMKSNNEIATLLQAPTAKEMIINSQFKTKGGIDTKRICPYATRKMCKAMNYGSKSCELIHFKKFVQNHTNESLGDCPMLIMCPDMDTCSKIHYLPDYNNGNNVLKT